MTLRRFAVATALAMMLALPAAAQTMQLNPTTPGDPSIGANPPPPMSSQASTKARRSSPVDINSASPAMLDALPGISQARADAIVKSRPFKSKDELVSRHIIPQNVYNRLKDKIVARQG
ncbi:ComEA family DNA-binding protein [Rhodopila sp.]|uniref:ComEA family DNA-binding protein n=1 Tax=Rhodopila sp. TaxID=2480087 RepID=UPI003D101E3F